MNKDHVYLLQTPLGRWFPAVFYSVNLGLWILTAIVVRAWDLLFLAILPVPALVLYIVRTRRNTP